MGEIADAIQYKVDVGLKKVLGAGIGIVAGAITAPAVANAFTFLQPYGITIVVDPVLFKTTMSAIGSMGIVGLHDYLKVKFPGIAWL